MFEWRVGLDERGRLVGAALAASQWPGLEQAQQPHATHAFAKQARQWGQPFAQHPAVRHINSQLEASEESQNRARTNADERGVERSLVSKRPENQAQSGKSAPQPAFSEGGMEKIFAWGLAEGVLDGFAAETAVFELWQPQEEGWKTAVGELQNLLNLPALAQFLTQLTRRATLPPIHISPNLLFPALTPVLAQANDGLHVLLPPPKAVGTSPPWPYREDPGWVLTQLAQTLLPQLLAEKLVPLPPAQQTLLIHAAIAACLAATLDPFESRAYLLRSKKLHNLPQLPQAAAQLEKYLVGEDDLLLGDWRLGD